MDNGLSYSELSLSTATALDQICSLARSLCPVSDIRNQVRPSAVAQFDLREKAGKCFMNGRDKLAGGFAEESKTPRPFLTHLRRVWVRSLLCSGFAVAQKFVSFDRSGDANITGVC